ncbi:MAG: hypothetical protein R2695_17995 [Acidimicrobiales bacterium]
MFTTGFKFYFGLTVGLALAGVLYGYTSGGDQTGPISLGWKGGVGELVGYTIFMGLALVALVIACTIVFFRDADPTDQAHYAGVDDIAPTVPVAGSHWPIVGAFGAATVALGLVLHPAVFVLGAAICGVVVFEWMMDAWADRATGDPVANRALRNRIMAPIEIPAMGAAAIGVVVLAVSQILLNASQLGAVVIAGVVATVILGIGVLAATGTRVNRNVVTGLALVVAVVVLGGGIWAAVDGPRTFEEHEIHSTDDDGSHGDTTTDHAEDPAATPTDGDTHSE